ncbi:hypothetical protein CO172_02740 [Candidatus Uhrbacteria bacterium CG_4_9_14_3_um_filter_36_7]|uniref:AbiEi antitoxin N-terminal domain-containing protein n=1 Tax=Candidatus Uhrbacteria bacterium CG_4_9_14_3_um_filter_36_7 TaxID=1975033 RepID=A0A2M7XH55_9BACT|nr:MAG: hypothetical protein CO172_02740 [Candidatus Uhrbacteria bacterium CG_4_9_14_3_um_filter_36_7]
MTFKVNNSKNMDRKPKKGEYLEVLLRSSKSIFSVKDVVLLWGEERKQKIAVRLNKYAKAGKLIRLRRGFYAKDKNYDRFELATRIYTPSYISFETVLTRTGINFQKYESIFIASYVTRDIEVDGQKISFIRIKGDILSNIYGIEHQGNIAIATKERAFLDRLYISKNYYFDNLNPLDWEKVFQILPIYNNKKMEKKVNDYFKSAKN